MSKNKEFPWKKYYKDPENKITFPDYNLYQVMVNCAKNHPYYYGVKVPIFCASEDGRRFLDIRLKHIGKPLTTNDYPRDKSDAPHKLI